MPSTPTKSDRSDASSDEPSPPTTPEVYKMSEKQKREKWRRVGEFGGVGILKKALDFYGITQKDNKQPSNPPQPEPAAETVLEVPKQPIARRAPPSKIVKPASKPPARPSTRPAVTLPNNVDSGNAPRAIGALRHDQCRTLPPKGVFTAPQPGMIRVMPNPASAPPAPPQPTLQQHPNPLWHAYWPGPPTMSTSSAVLAPRPNPLRPPPWKRSGGNQFRR